MRRLIWPVLFALVFGSGCVGVGKSLNVQRSVLRDTGDTGMTAVLENQASDEVEGIAKGAIEICFDVLNFFDTGNIGLLTKSELRKSLINVVPEGYADFVDDMLSLVSVANVDVELVGKRNIKRIQAFVKGVIRGAEEYDVEDRE